MVVLSDLKQDIDSNNKKKNDNNNLLKSNAKAEKFHKVGVVIIYFLGLFGLLIVNLISYKLLVNHCKSASEKLLLNTLILGKNAAENEFSSIQSAAIFTSKIIEKNNLRFDENDASVDNLLLSTLQGT